MRRCKPRIRLPLRRRMPRLQPLYSANLRQRLYLRQQLRRRMYARRLSKRKRRRRKPNCAACSFAGGAGERILPRIGFAGTAALLGALSRPLRGRKMRRRNLRLQPLCRHLRGRKPSLPPPRQYLRRRMRARRRRKRKLRRRGMYRRNFRKRKPSCVALWPVFAARLRRSPSGLWWAGRCWLLARI